MSTNAVEIFGTALADATGKPLLACKGIIRLVASEMYDGANPNELGFKQMQKVIQEGLNAKLEKLLIHNNTEIIAKMTKLLNESQSIFVLGSI